MNKNRYTYRNIMLLQNKVLYLREKLFEKIHKYIKMMTVNSDFTSVVISINLKGFPKSFEKLNIVFNSIIELFEKFFFEKRIISCKLFTGMLGIKLVIVIKESPMILKYISYKIEKNLRFLDIDIFYNNKFISSSILGLNKKKCIICSNNYDYCLYNKRHTIRILRRITIYKIKKFTG